MLKTAVVLACSFLVLAAAGCGKSKSCICGQSCGVGAACDTNGNTCSEANACIVCSGNGGPAEDREASCGDGRDNDCDGRLDCDDPDCQQSGTAQGGVCDGQGNRCGAPDASGHATCGAGGGGGGGAGGAAIGTLLFLGSDFYVLGTAGSGFQEQATLTFRVTDASGAPYAGVQLAFTHESQRGSFLGETPQCSQASPSMCSAEAVTDADGEARVLLTSGTQYGALSVRVQATAAGVTKSLVAGGITVVGAKPNGAHFSLDCATHNLPALTHDDCLYSNYCGDLGTVSCTVKLADRYGAIVGVPTHVGFRAEAGAVPPSTVSIGFDASKSASGQQAVGHAEAFFEVCNSPLPWDVEPLPGERFVSGVFRCGARKVNPRDGLVTLIAFAHGEEGFTDGFVGGLFHPELLNGKYDLGESFADLPEPFVDVDDNGKHDPGEPYVDANGDGVWNDANGVWDADTLLWTQTRLLYTGHPAFGQDGAGNELFTRFFKTGSLPDPTPTPPAIAFRVNKGPPPTSDAYLVFFTDQNLNPLSSLAEYAATATTDNVAVKLTGPSPTVDSIGTDFTQLYCAGVDDLLSCKAGPIEQACTTAPCHVVWDVGSCRRNGSCTFTYGSTGRVSITGKEVGSDLVEASAKLENVKTSFFLGGVCEP